MPPHSCLRGGANDRRICRAAYADHRGLLDDRQGHWQVDQADVYHSRQFRGELIAGTPTAMREPRRALLPRGPDTAPNPDLGGPPHASILSLRDNPGLRNWVFAVGVGHQRRGAVHGELVDAGGELVVGVEHLVEGDVCPVWAAMRPMLVTRLASTPRLTSL